ncbi:uncharacterized protein LOC143285676 [Babylonia areolata]|uniref:uncharacterized protein LOC143285676 n=1 Tax=Babylonia areolata TaxID=304850 RepID=UPI003FD26812
MEMEVDKFEREKLLDVKTVLTELVKIEMLYHAKALEFLSRCYENTQSIDVDADINAFRRAVTKSVQTTSPGDNSARSLRSGMDAATLTTTGCTTRSSDTRASGTLSSASFSSTGGRSMQSQRSQATVQRRLSQSVQPSPRGRQPSPRGRQPSPQGRQPSTGRPSPRVRISSRMYQDDDDEEEDSDDEYD